jgi:hypothetical protein
MWDIFFKSTDLWWIVHISPIGPSAVSLNVTFSCTYVHDFSCYVSALGCTHIHMYMFLMYVSSWIIRQHNSISTYVFLKMFTNKGQPLRIIK